MSGGGGPRVFVSYARSDRDFAVTLRDELTAAGITVWHDLKDLEAGQWWRQIAGALMRDIEHIVLVVSPEAQASKIVAQECWLAQREGLTAWMIVPPRHKGKIDFAALPAWLRALQHHDFTEPDAKRAIIEGLRKPGRGARRPPPPGPQLPDGYVVREAETSALRRVLLDEKGESTKATVVLHGSGGFGKTTLASHFINTEGTQQAFFNGILFTQLGEELVKLPKTYDGRAQLSAAIKMKLEGLIAVLTGMSATCPDLATAKLRLKQLIADRGGYILLWVDDVWAEQHVQHFFDAAPDAAKLITTRVASLLPSAVHIPVDELSAEEAFALVASGLPATSETDRVTLRHLATVTAGRWPLLLRQINAQLRYQTKGQAGRPPQAVGVAAANLQKRLARDGLDGLDKASDNDRARAVRLSVDISFEMLRTEDEHSRYPDGFHEARFRDLAGFQEAEIPIATIARLWDHLGSLKGLGAVNAGSSCDDHWPAVLDESTQLLERLYVLALLQGVDSDGPDGTIKLHDVMRQYLADRQRDTIDAFHRHFVMAYDSESVSPSLAMTERERRYFFKWYPRHLAAAGETETAEAIVLDPAWLQRKLEALGNPQLLALDCGMGSTTAHRLAGRVLNLSAPILENDRSQLAPQLLCRLQEEDAPDIEAFKAKVRRHLRYPALMTTQPTLSLRAELRRLDDGTSAIRSLCELPNGWLAAGSEDGIIRIWNVESGTLVRRMGSGRRPVTKLAVLPDGQMIVGCQGDRPGVTLWDWRNAVQTRSIDADGTTLCVLLDGRVATGVQDIKLWDPETSKLTSELKSNPGRWGIARTLCELSDGRLASGSGETAIRVWDVAAGKEIALLTEYLDKFEPPLCALSDGRLAFGSRQEHGVRLWNFQKESEVISLLGHQAWVSDLCEVATGVLASSSHDHTIRLWDIASGELISTIGGHTAAVLRLCTLRGGRLVSGAQDGSLRVWDVDRLLSSAFQPHGSRIVALGTMPDGSVASASHDNTIAVSTDRGVSRRWRVPTSARNAGYVYELRDIVTSMCVLVDGRIAAASRVAGRSNLPVLYEVDGNISIWHRDHPNPVALLKGHSGAVFSLCRLADGRLASAARDGTLRIWDLARAEETMRIAISSGGEMCALGSGGLALCRSDGVALLDPKLETEALLRHPAFVTAACLTGPDELATAAEDGIIRVWNLSARTEIQSFRRGSTATALTSLTGGRLASAYGDSVDRRAMSYRGDVVQPVTDNSVRIWDIAGGIEVAHLTFDAPIDALASTPTGELLAGDAIGNVHRLRLIEHA